LLGEWEKLRARLLKIDDFIELSESLVTFFNQSATGFSHFA
jgi:hypothetical protein